MLLYKYMKVSKFRYGGKTDSDKSVNKPHIQWGIRREMQ